MDYVEVLTDLRTLDQQNVDVSTDALFRAAMAAADTLVVELGVNIELNGGVRVFAGSYRFSLINGQALTTTSTFAAQRRMHLPITEDSVPELVPLYLSVFDKQGRKREVGAIPYVPREVGPLNLNDILGDVS